MQRLKHCSMHPLHRGYCETQPGCSSLMVDPIRLDFSIFNDDETLTVLALSHAPAARVLSNVWLLT